MEKEAYRQGGGTVIKAQDGVPWVERGLRIEGAPLGIHTAGLGRQPAFIIVIFRLQDWAPHPGVKLLTSSIKATATGNNSSFKLWPHQVLGLDTPQRVNVPKSSPMMLGFCIYSGSSHSFITGHMLT